MLYHWRPWNRAYKLSRAVRTENGQSQQKAILIIVIIVCMFIIVIVVIIIIDIIIIIIIIVIIIILGGSRHVRPLPRHVRRPDEGGRGRGPLI